LILTAANQPSRPPNPIQKHPK
jgi:hypothetical protein